MLSNLVLKYFKSKASLGPNYESNMLEKDYLYSRVSNNRTVWNKPEKSLNKRTGQGIFPKLINAQGKIFLGNK